MLTARQPFALISRQRADNGGFLGNSPRQPANLCEWFLSNNVSDATKLVLADAVGIALLPEPTDVNGWLVH